ncbi:hypothetical protein [Fictibacillus phosphorivorans]|uniref:Uncharacterized protein n=1 Tax=Fictibacillus phosphorivorans TaxID=1221500 RepID=A0A160INH8_9BACL|nr:hypothetical protein [Fictibacillus phosphorivorans]ANC77092.1 hypothetical protein ABE65_009865 [Fictibacillus phosphorivorans]MQR96280.1 hypothetical protein [Fictibacillus phosphorivorans]
MKKISTWSVMLLMLGLFLVCINGDFIIYSEWTMLVGLLIIMLGTTLCFLAFLQMEKGNAKSISLVLSILVIFFITWFKPFELIRIISWLKNIS